MQPYQQASEAIKRQKSEPIELVSNIAKGATSFGASAYGLHGASRLLAFINPNLPKNLAIKGISKVNPTVGKFLNHAVNNGFSPEEALGFVGEKLTSNERSAEAGLSPSGFPLQKSSKSSSSQKNLIEEHAPEIHEILIDKIGQGLQPLAVAAQLASESKFKKKISELQKKTGSKFEDLVASIFGKENPAAREQFLKNMPNQSQAALQPQMQGQSIPGGSAEANAFANINKQHQPQMGQGSQALMNAIKELRKIRGG